MSINSGTINGKENRLEKEKTRTTERGDGKILTDELKGKSCKSSSAIRFHLSFPTFTSGHKFSKASEIPPISSLGQNKRCIVCFEGRYVSFWIAFDFESKKARKPMQRTGNEV